MAMRAGDGPRQPDLSALDRMAGMKAPSLSVTKGKDGDLEASARGTMAFRSGVSRVFGRGKSEGDVAANKATLDALLDHIEAKAGKVVRDRVLGGEIRLKGDDQVLTVKQRLERGTYVSSELVAQLKALAEKEMGKQTSVQTGNRNATREFMGGEGGARELVAKLAKEDDRHPRAWAEIDRRIGGGGPLAQELNAHLQAYAEDATSRGRGINDSDVQSVARDFLQGKLGGVVKDTNRRFAEAALADGKSMAGTIREGWLVQTGKVERLRDVRGLADQIEKGGMVGQPGPDQRSVDHLLTRARTDVTAKLEASDSQHEVPSELDSNDIVHMMSNPDYEPLLGEIHRQREGAARRVGADAATFPDLAALGSKESSQAKLAAKDGQRESGVRDGDRAFIRAQDMVRNLLPPPQLLGVGVTSALDTALPAPDRFAELQRKLDELTTQHGGLEGRTPWELKEAVSLAREVARALPALERLAETLRTPPLSNSTATPPLSEVGAALGGAAKQIQATLAKLPLD